ncbi:MAG: galactokinase [Dyadobacter fermentans]
MQQAVLQQFRHLYGGEAALYRAPGRINLLGEHTDYNGGFVLPAAVDREIWFAIRRNDGDVCRVYAMDLQEEDQFEVSNVQQSPKSWPNYLRGVVAQLVAAGYPVTGFDLVFGGNIPQGAGMSSSAALECGLATALNDVHGFQIPKTQLALLAQKAEHEYAGVHCGIMDQFASIHGCASRVIRLDCRSMEFAYFPIDLSRHTLLLCNTGVKHSLASSEYNTRRNECEQGLAAIRLVHPAIATLRDVSPAILADFVPQLPENVAKRLTYVVQENDRVEQATAALESSDLHRFGQLMYDTHAGLRDVYAVSCAELDFLVDQTIPRPDVLGARMMGGGFGGCTLNLVETAGVDVLVRDLSNAYFNAFGVALEVYPVKIVDGCGKAAS